MGSRASLELDTSDRAAKIIPLVLALPIFRLLATPQLFANNCEDVIVTITRVRIPLGNEPQIPVLPNWRSVPPAVP